MRTFLAYVNMLNFLFMIFVTIYVLFNYVGELQDWWLTLYGYYVILGCCGLAMSFWIGVDGKRLERYANKIRSLEKRLIELEEKIRLIKQ